MVEMSLAMHGEATDDSFLIPNLKTTELEKYHLCKEDQASSTRGVEDHLYN